MSRCAYRCIPAVAAVQDAAARARRVAAGLRERARPRRRATAGGLALVGADAGLVAAVHDLTAAEAAQVFAAAGRLWAEGATVGARAPGASRYSRLWVGAAGFRLDAGACRPPPSRVYSLDRLVAPRAH
jgi:hypothetical protein